MEAAAHGASTKVPKKVAREFVAADEERGETAPDREKGERSRGTDFLQRSSAMRGKPPKVHRHDTRHPTNGKYVPKKATGPEGDSTYNDGRHGHGPFDYL